MRERPILFSGSMVRAIDEGRKTQTRRPLNPQPDARTTRMIDGIEREPFRWWPMSEDDYTGEGVYSPFGVPGDRLWVRETWSLMNPERTTVVLHGYHRTPEEASGLDVVYQATERHGHRGWRPSIHMPRWASRITLEVTGIRVERLQAITEDDAIAEGARRWDHIPDPARDRTPWGVGPRWSMLDPRTTDDCLTAPRFAFGNAWDKINGARAPWSSNPWVWVVKFRKLAAEERAA